MQKVPFLSPLSHPWSRVLSRDGDCFIGFTFPQHLLVPTKAVSLTSIRGITTTNLFISNKDCFQTWANLIILCAMPCFKHHNESSRLNLEPTYLHFCALPTEPTRPGFEKSTRPLAFASALPGRASRILASLARPGERFPPGPIW